MILWNETMYFGDTVKKKHRKIMRQIEHGKKVSDVFCIAFASNEANLFDILPTKELKFPYYKRKEVHVVGLAKGMDEALGLVTGLVDEIYRETGGFDVRAYFGPERR